MIHDRLPSSTTTTMTTTIMTNVHEDRWRQTRPHHLWKGAQATVSTIVWALGIFLFFFFTPLMFFLNLDLFNNDKGLASSTVGRKRRQQQNFKRGFETRWVFFFLVFKFFISTNDYFHVDDVYNDDDAVITVPAYLNDAQRQVKFQQRQQEQRDADASRCSRYFFFFLN